MGTLLRLCAVAALFCLSMQRSVPVILKPDPTHGGMAGREFVISFLQNFLPSYDRAVHRLYISTTEKTATVKVQVPSAKFKRTLSVRPFKTVVFTLPRKIELCASKKSYKTVLVDATADVSITSFSFKKYTGDISVVYPTKTWGTEYLIFTPSSSPRGTYKEFSVTNGKEGNKIEIYLQGNVNFEGRNYRKGQKLQVNLLPYQALEIQSLHDLTNTRIVSQKPVAVITGHSCTMRFAKCNHVYEQLLPVSAWGKNIIVPPISFQTKFDSVYIQTSQDTKIKINFGKKSKTIIIRGWSVYEVRQRRPLTLSIQANRGIQVLLLFNGKTFGRNQFYDPFLINMLPTEYFCSSYLLLPFSGFTNQALIVAKKNAAKKMRFPTKKGQWAPVTNTDFLWMELSVKRRNNQILSSPGSPFGLYSFGVGYMNGYGSAGHCIKPVGRPPVTCENIKCGFNTICQMKGGNPTCVPKPTGVQVNCWAMGDPHYKTFDGKKYDFMGTCAYTMAKNCEKRSDLPYFEVIAQNENRGNKRVSFVALVTVNVYDTTISIARSERGHVRVDNALWTLPVNLKDNKLVVSQRGFTAVIETDFGLTVSYNWDHKLVITLSKEFRGKTCGLCGNFNGNPKDDFNTPAGQLASGVTAFGSSWKVAGLVNNAKCRDGCVGGCNKCKSKHMAKWAGKNFCGVITLKNGPFSSCHAVVDPEVYFENCKYDLCMGGGNKRFFCKVLEAYTDECQAAGVQVEDWMKVTRCSQRCPANSKFNLCGSACPATCSNPNGLIKCHLGCVQTCTCKKGFVLSGNKCVPVSKCGCTHNGHYIPAGESFWADKKCQQWCKCIPGTRKVQCRNKGCAAGSQCLVVDGIRKCHSISYSTCHATGDPHYLSFDNKRFDFQGTCVYQLVGLCNDKTDLVPFQVLVQNDPWGGRRVSITKLVEIKVYSFSIIITRTHRYKILINNVITNLPVSLNDGRISVHKSANKAVLTTDFGLKLTYDWTYNLYVTLPSTYKGAVCGLCGNYNGQVKDDLIPKDGDKPVSPADFGDSWKVAEIPGCEGGCKGACPRCDINEKILYEKEDFCGKITDPKGSFRDCHSTVDPAGYFKDCVFDVCMYKGRRDVLCKSIASYTAACQASGATVHSWRTKEFCAMKCPKNSFYEMCSTSCPANCKDLAPPKDCKDQCEEGCTCKEGFLLSGKACVPFEMCGCIHNELYYNFGEVFFPSGECKEKCKCKRGGEVVCKKMSCTSDEECRIKDGIHKCYPTSEGVCHASGDPHYTSFDGKRYDFQGTCTYTLSKTCKTKGTDLDTFSVNVENVQWDRMIGRKVVSVARLVTVEVYGFTFILKYKTSGVLVNGVYNALPLNLNNGEVQVFKEGARIVIATQFGLRVTYDLIYHVTVTVPSNYRSKVCGLCGNFNDNKKDDFIMAGGRITPDVNQFALSWKVAFPGVSCSNGCRGSSCPTCPTNRKAVFSARHYCGIATADKGPFAICHSKLDPQSYFDDCVFDLCAANGDGDVLCSSLASYAFSCHKVGVDIKNWRTPSFCPMKCPANSHYEVCADLCSASCDGLTDIIPCAKSCTEGCECNAGFLFNGEKCVKEDECGCYDNGKTYKPDEEVFDDNCKSKCTCFSDKGLVCEDHSCPKNTKCMIRKGRMACYDPDPCRAANCRPKEKCKLVKGEAVCIPLYTGTCWAWGDPHYRTFDGYNFDFQGICKYVISQTCGELNGLVPFTVTERNENRGNKAVSYVREVDVTVYEYTITVRRNQVGKVTVNGELLNIPVQLGDGEVSVVYRGRSVMVETNFGLTVSYDWNWKLVIKLPSSYHNSVCGLCGNFNGNSRDELQNPAGNDVASITEWGKSWKTPDQVKDSPCWDACEKDCPVCEAKKLDTFKTKNLCGALKYQAIFRQCHRKVEAEAFVNSCAYDMCMNNGDKKMLCRALASYTEQCSQAGVVVWNWRKRYGCPMNCPRYSRYSDCGSACPLTCPFVKKPQRCNKKCVQGCMCIRGYALSDGACVPVKSCGCSYQGRYYKAGQRFWANDACGRRCKCDASLGMVTCEEASCSANERCGVLNGERACVPTSHATCTASGDPHYTTFDGHKFDFQGTCVYQLAKLCSDNPDLVPFKVNVQNDHRGRKSVSFTKTVEISIYGITITLSRDFPNKVLLNNEFALVPVDYSDDLKISRSGQKAVVETAAGITVTFDWRSRVTINVPSTYRGALCGLCGNYNGVRKDDRAMRNGEATTNTEKFGESWKVALIPGCSSFCEGTSCKTCSTSMKNKYKHRKYCGIIVDKSGPFRKCHKHVDPAPYMDDCAFDACQFEGHQKAVCEAVASYVSACQSKGIPISRWRTNKFCPMDCPANSHYALCASGCPVTCAMLRSAATCRRPCAESCECNQGYLLSEGACVPVRKCGCTFEGRYYRQGEAFYSSGKCLEKCTCGPNAAVTCKLHRCPRGELCKVVKGVRGCYAQENAKCVASGDPHYTSFDGRKFDFQGICVYTLATVCRDPQQSVTPFTVIQGNRKYGNRNVAVTKSISINVYGHDIFISQGRPWKVDVDNELQNLPLSLRNGRVKVSQEGKHVVVQTDFGLKVLYDTVYYVEVIVPSSYKNKICGLCGNYNKHKNDDFRLPNNAVTSNVDTFGKSWVVDMPSHNCGGCGRQCPVCNKNKVATFKRKNSCGIMSDPRGPFKSCHGIIPPTSYVSDCVFDICTVDGDKETLCKSVQAYALACQNAGVQVQPWRSKSYCPANCPPNSHYSQCANTCDGSCARLLTPFACNKACFEGCQCNPGFVFDGDRCVTIQQCGCVHEGKYLTVGQTVVSKNCKRSCVCQSSGVVQCKKMACSSGELCDARHGVRGCHVKDSQCRIGDSGSFMSFDGMSGTMSRKIKGAFELASVCNEDAKMWFRVVVDMRLCNRRIPPAVATVYVFFKEATVAVNSQLETWINGRKATLPGKVGEHISLSNSGRSVTIQLKSAVQVTYSISQVVTVRVKSNLMGKMCGACGNYNEDSKDDMTTSDGKTTKDVSVVVSSWSAGDFSQCGL